MCFPLGLAQQSELPSAHSMVERASTKSTPGADFLKKMAKESILDSCRQRNPALQFRFRRQLLPQPVEGFEFARPSGRLDAVKIFLAGRRGSQSNCIEFLAGDELAINRNDRASQRHTATAAGWCC
jgi:hypothetical protein